MKRAIATAMLLAVSAVAGCASGGAPMSSADQEYLYGTHAGQPQRPSLMN